MSTFTPNYFVEFTRDDGTTVDVGVLTRCEDYRLPHYMVDHIATLIGTDTVVELTDAEVERLDQMVAEDPPVD